MKSLLFVSLLVVSVTFSTQAAQVGPIPQNHFPSPDEIEQISFEVSYYVGESTKIGADCRIDFGDWVEKLALLENPKNPEKSEWLVEIKYSKYNCAMRTYLPVKDVVQQSVLEQDYIHDPHGQHYIHDPHGQHEGQLDLNERQFGLNQAVYFIGGLERADYLDVTAFNIQMKRLRRCTIFLNSPLTVVGFRGPSYLVEMQAERKGNFCTKGDRFLSRGEYLGSHKYHLQNKPDSEFVYYIGGSKDDRSRFGRIGISPHSCLASFGAKMKVIEWGLSENLALVEVMMDNYIDLAQYTTSVRICSPDDPLIIDRRREENIILGL